MINLELINKYSDDFQKLYKLYTDFVSHTNISAITEEADVYKKHFEDSLVPYSFLLSIASPEKTLEVVDVGTGGGFPTLPLAIVAAKEGLLANFTALDSTAKKLKFIEIIKEELGLANLNTVAARAEDLAESKREFYDVALCRSVAHLRIVLELCVPLIKKDGYFLAYKQCGNELEEAATAIKYLGVELIDRIVYFNDEREILIFKKNQKTKKLYPRKYSVIKKSPL